MNFLCLILRLLVWIGLFCCLVSVWVFWVMIFVSEFGKGGGVEFFVGFGWFF